MAEKWMSERAGGATREDSDSDQAEDSFPDDQALLRDLGLTKEQADRFVGDESEAEDSEDAPKARPQSLSGVGRGYSWTETAEALELLVDLPAGDGTAGVHASELAVAIRPTKLRVALRGVELLAGDLEGVVQAEDCVWALSEDRTHLELHLAKKRFEPRPDDPQPDTIWASVFKQADERQIIHEIPM